MRREWSSGRNYDVICHGVWSVRCRNHFIRAQTLKHQPDYIHAKKDADFAAAQTIIDNLLSREALERIAARTRPERFALDPMMRRPVLVAPSKPGGSNNVIPLLTAYNIGFQLNMGVDRDIVQKPGPGRTGKSAMSRLIHQAEFAGHVAVGREYIIVDDNFTMGGTIAALCGYIESGGGKVIATTVLADRSLSTQPDVRDRIRSHDVRLAVSAQTRDEIRSRHGWTFERIFQREMGFPVASLTEREAKFVSGFPGQRAFFRAVDECRTLDSSRSRAGFHSGEPARAPVIT